MSDYIIGVDAGGTKTHAVVYDKSAISVFECFTGMGNMNVDSRIAMENICKAIAICMEKINEPAFICIGAAGITAKGNNDALYECLQKDFGDCEIKIVSDAFLAFYANLEGHDGILVISGTGSIGYAKKGNEICRTGGWGHILGDEGSGYIIALNALKSIFADYDAQRPFSNLAISLMQKIGASDVFDIIEFVYQNSKNKVAELFMVIVALANAGDVQAQKILRDGACDLAEFVKGLVSKVNFRDEIKISFSGSVVLHCDILRDRLLELLADLDIKFDISVSNISPTIGAYYVYKESC